jgi:hypothetical protein
LVGVGVNPCVIVGVGVGTLHIVLPVITPLDKTIIFSGEPSVSNIPV